MIKGLRWKFILINMTIVTVMLLVIFGMVLHSTASDMKQWNEGTMRFLMEREYSKPRSLGEASGMLQLPYFSVSLNPDGKVLEVNGKYFDLSDEKTLENILKIVNRREEDIGLIRSYNLRFYRKDKPFGRKIIFLDVSGEMAILQGQIESCVLIGLIAFSAFLGMSFYLARWAVRPVEIAWEQQRQFVADASHELKTPLTVIMTNAELLTQPDYEAQQKQKSAASILTMSYQMRGLVENLLDLARVDNSSANMVFSRLDLTELLSEALLPFEPVFFERGLTLESRLERGIFLWGSDSHLRQVADILLDNAAKYSSLGGAVVLTLKRQGNHCLLQVSSPGEQISKEDLQNIFRRFYRLDKARAMDASYGLGLSIAQGLVQQHGGKIWAESERGINSFFVQLPTA